MSSGGTAAQDAQTTSQATAQPHIQMVGQYIKDISFENPGAPSGLSASPQIEFGVDLHAKPISPDHYEVVLRLRVDAKNEDKSLFLLELAYAGLLRLENIPEDAIQPVLLIQAPILLFPFARRIVADMVRDGGMPPLMVEPIDFAGLYQNRMARAAQQPPQGAA